MSYLDTFSGQVLQQVAAGATDIPVVAQSRLRLAAATHLGYEQLDRYAAWRPTIFALACVGALVSTAAAVRRRKVPEAVVLYSLTGLGSAGLAWVTRPVAAPPAATQLPPVEAKQASTTAQVLGYLDRRGADLTRRQPGWESRTLARLLRDVGAGTLHPAVNILVTSKSH